MQAEAVRINPELECRIPSQFSALQNQDTLKYLSLEESVMEGYLIGPTMSQRLCRKKMNEDAVILLMTFGTSDEVDEMVYEQKVGAFDKVGTVGESSSRHRLCLMVAGCRDSSDCLGCASVSLILPFRHL